MSYHAKLSPSGADRWEICTASPAMEQDYPDETSEAAAHGTAAHLLGAAVLRGVVAGLKTAAKDYEGCIIWVPDSQDEDEGESERFIDEDAGENAPMTGFSFMVDKEMISAIDEYVDQILIQGYDDIYVEVAVPIGHLTGEKDATGTADCVGIKYDGDHNRIGVHDLKFGKSPKGIVYATENRQMSHYMLGALDEFSWLADFDEFDMHIHQPRLNHHDHWECSEGWLKGRLDIIKVAALAIHAGRVTFRPGEKQCFFCRHRANCEDYAAFVNKTVMDDFPVVETKGPRGGIKAEAPQGAHLNEAYAKVGMVERWCTAIRAASARELEHNRENMPDWKFVAGKNARSFTDLPAVEDWMKRSKFKADDYAPRKFMSAAQLEKLTGKDYYKANIAEYVEWKKGNPQIKPISDPKPELDLAGDMGFENLEDDDFEE